MKMISKELKKRKWLSIFILFVFIVSATLPLVIAVDSKYNSALVKRTEYKKVEEYDEKAWKKIVNTTEKPNDLFKGDAEQVKAEMKYTIRAIYKTKWNLLDILAETYIADIIFAGLLLNFSETALEDKFDNTYYGWYGLRGTWRFITEEFEEEPDKVIEKIPIIRDPKALKKALNEYNDLITDLNNPILTTMSGDEFIYTLFISDFAVPAPIHDYLDELVEELDCKNTKAKGNKLILDRIGLDDYTIELEFSEIGVVSSITYLDSDNNIIYKIISYNTQRIPLIILGFCGGIIAGIVGIAIIRVKKRK
ncbi:MAG: hypothetical protein ACTSR8_10805 [Promethearchaeota archaeon]